MLISGGDGNDGNDSDDDINAWFTDDWLSLWRVEAPLPESGPARRQRRPRDLWLDNGGGAAEGSARAVHSADVRLRILRRRPRREKCCLMVPQRYFSLHRRTIKIHISYYSIRYDFNIEIYYYFMALCIFMYIIILDRTWGLSIGSDTIYEVIRFPLLVIDKC